MTAFIPFEEAPAGSAEGRRQIKCAIGQDSHAFGGYRPLKLGGGISAARPKGFRADPRKAGPHFL